jgi:Spy/CpxP family protein refolding chaperone
MKKILIICLTTALLGPMALSLSAQNEPTKKGPGGERGAKMERMYEALGVSDEQKARLTALAEKHRAESEAIRSNEALAPEQKREQRQALRSAHQAEIASVLTPEQRTKMEQIRAERFAKKGDKKKTE